MSINFPALAEAEGKLEARRKELHDIFDQAGDGGEGTLDLSKVQGHGDPNEVAAKIRQLNDEMTDLGEKVENLRVTASTAEQIQQADQRKPAGAEAGAPQARPAGSIGAMFVNSAAWSGRSNRVEAELDVDPIVAMRPKNTLFETGTGWAPESIRTGLVVPDAQRPVQVTDILPQVPTSQAAYKYMEETTFTSNAAEVSEGGAYGEAALELTEKSVTIEKVGVWIPVTDEQLEDVIGAQAYLDSRLPFMLRQRVDSQILNGDGNTPNIEGIANVSGTQSQAKSTDPVPDAVYKAMTKVKVTGRAMPGAVVFHPNDWQDVRLLRTSDGIYIWGSPSEAGPARIWGNQVVESDAQSENTAVVGDWANFSLLVTRRGITTKVTDSHSDYFVKGKQAIRADVRLATVWLRPAAFCEVTGI